MSDAVAFQPPDRRRIFLMRHGEAAYWRCCIYIIVVDMPADGAQVRTSYRGAARRRRTRQRIRAAR